MKIKKEVKGKEEGDMAKRGKGMSEEGERSDRIWGRCE